MTAFVTTYFKLARVTILWFPLLAFVIGAWLAPGNDPSLSTRVWSGAVGALGAYVVLSMVFGLYALIVAPYEQRNHLRTEVFDVVAEVAGLETELSQEPVGESHSKELKEILEHAKKYVLGL